MKNQKQLDKFRTTARKLEADENEEAFELNLKKVVKPAQNLDDTAVNRAEGKLPRNWREK